MRSLYFFSAVHQVSNENLLEADYGINWSLTETSLALKGTNLSMVLAVSLCCVYFRNWKQLFSTEQLGKKQDAQLVTFGKIVAKPSFVCLVTNIKDGMIAPCWRFQMILQIYSFIWESSYQFATSACRSFAAGFFPPTVHRPDVSEKCRNLILLSCLVNRVFTEYS